MITPAFHPGAQPLIRRDKEPLNLSTLKFTALMYLVEAGRKEDYEQMNEIIRYAREFGATTEEINAILGIDGLKQGGTDEYNSQ